MAFCKLNNLLTVFGKRLIGAGGGGDPGGCLPFASSWGVPVRSGGGWVLGQDAGRQGAGVEREAAPGGFGVRERAGDAQARGLGRVQQPGKESGAPPSRPAPHFLGRVWALAARLPYLCRLTGHCRQRCFLTLRRRWGARGKEVGWGCSGGAGASEPLSALADAASHPPHPCVLAWPPLCRAPWGLCPNLLSPSSAPRGLSHLSPWDGNRGPLRSPRPEEGVEEP